MADRERERERERERTKIVSSYQDKNRGIAHPYKKDSQYFTNQQDQN